MGVSHILLKGDCLCCKQIGEEHLIMTTGSVQVFMLTVKELTMKLI